jgi:hypothetical protein
MELEQSIDASIDHDVSNLAKGKPFNLSKELKLEGQKGNPGYLQFEPREIAEPCRRRLVELARARYARKLL